MNNEVGLGVTALIEAGYELESIEGTLREEANYDFENIRIKAVIEDFFSEHEDFEFSKKYKKNENNKKINVTKELLEYIEPIFREKVEDIRKLHTNSPRLFILRYLSTTNNKLLKDFLRKDFKRITDPEKIQQLDEKEIKYYVDSVAKMSDSLTELYSETNVINNNYSLDDWKELFSKVFLFEESSINMTKEAAFKIAHVLKFDKRTFVEFSLKCCETNQILYTNPHDLIHIYCLSHEQYNDINFAEMMIKKFNENVKKRKKQKISINKRNNDFTRLMERKAEADISSEDYINYLIQNRAYLDSKQYTARKVYCALLQHLYDTINASLDDTVDALGSLFGKEDDFLLSLLDYIENEECFVEIEIGVKDLVDILWDKGFLYRSKSKEVTKQYSNVFKSQKSFYINMIMDLATGKKAIKKEDVLFMFWLNFICWTDCDNSHEELSLLNRIQHKGKLTYELNYDSIIFHFIKMGNTILEKAMLGKIYVPHLFEQTMIMSLWCYNVKDSGLETTIISNLYNDIFINSLEDERDKSYHRKKNSREEERNADVYIYGLNRFVNNIINTSQNRELLFTSDGIKTSKETKEVIQYPNDYLKVIFGMKEIIEDLLYHYARANKAINDKTLKKLNRDFSDFRYVRKNIVEIKKDYENQNYTAIYNALDKIVKFVEAYDDYIEFVGNSKKAIQSIGVEMYMKSFKLNQEEIEAKKMYDKQIQKLLVLINEDVSFDGKSKAIDRLIERKRKLINNDEFLEVKPISMKKDNDEIIEDINLNLGNIKYQYGSLKSVFSYIDMLGHEISDFYIIYKRNQAIVKRFDEKLYCSCENELQRQFKRMETIIDNLKLLNEIIRKSSIALIGIGDKMYHELHVDLQNVELLPDYFDPYFSEFMYTLSKQIDVKHRMNQERNPKITLLKR